MTLVEALVVASLGFLLLATVVKLLIPVFQWSAKTTARAQLQESCATAMRQVEKLLQNSNAAGLAVLSRSNSSPNTVVAFQPVDLQAGGSKPAYLTGLESLIFYSAEGKLYQKSWDTAPSSLSLSLNADAATRLTVAQLSQLATLSPPTSLKFLSQDVVDFSVASSTGAPNVGNPLTVRLALERKVASGDPERCALQATIFLRNSP